MSVWLVEPIDPLIARDGRPSGFGGRLATVEFPFPSMIAGAVRTRMGSAGGAFVIPPAHLGELKAVPVQGPLLAELTADGTDVLQWLTPAPRDAVFLRDDQLEAVSLKRLIPHRLEDGEALDSFGDNALLPVSYRDCETYGKPPEGLPAFWKWSEFETWLTTPEDRRDVKLACLGVGRLPVETRGHLAIQPGERVGIDGMLFQTAGLRFLQAGACPLTPRRFALSLSCQEATVAERTLKLEAQIAPLGGERRLARWSPASREWPRIPASVREEIVATGRARLILLTPAIFAKGALPAWSGEPWPLGGPIQATVRAACVPRPEVVSGWDLAAKNEPGKPKGRPKHTRRLAPAGSVYFLELSGGTPEDRRRWCDATWLACVSDDVQECRDGFGLAALGTWEDKL